MAELYCENVFPTQLRTQAELVCAAAFSHDLVEPLSSPAEALIQAEPHPSITHAWITESGQLVGYGNLDSRRADTIELAVHPTYRKKGWGEALLRTLLDAAQGSGPAARPMVWSHGDLPAARHLAHKLGLHRTRELLRMSCPTDCLVVNLPDLSPDVTILTLAEADARFGQDTMNAEMVRVNNAAFSWHPEQSGWTTDDVVSRRHEPWFAPDECFVALLTDQPEGQSTPRHLAPESGAAPRVAGFVWTKLHGVSPTTPAGEAGELYLVGVHPHSQGKRIGTVLTSLAFRRLAARGVPELILYVEGDNTNALKVYGRSGFSVARRDVAYVTD